MNWFHWAGNNNKGSVTILAIGIMAFLGIILSGVLPMITQEIRIGTMNRDVVEAQYAAESGLKRTIAGMETGSTSWAWIGQARQFTSEAGKTYTVTVQATSPNPLTNGVAPAAGWYHLQSVGRVGNATKTVSVRVNITGGGLSGVFANGVFGASGIKMDSNPQITGSAGTNGGITMENHSQITGNATAAGTIYVNPWSNAKISGTQTSNSASTAVPTFSVAFTTPTKPTKPTAPTAPAVVSSVLWPVGTWSVTQTVSAGNYSTTANLQSDRSTITTPNNTKIYVNGNFTMWDSTWTMGSNTLVDVLGGGMSLTGTSTLQTQGNSTLYIRDGLAISKSLSMGANSVAYTGQGISMEASSSLTLPGASTLYMANGSLAIGNMANLTMGTNSSVYAGQGIALGESSTMLVPGASTLYMANGSLGLGSKANLTMGTNSTIYAGQGLQTNSNATLALPGAATLYLANGSLTAGSNSVITLGSVGSKSLLYCNGSTNISGATINLNGPAIGAAPTEVYFTGSLSMNSGATLNISGNVIIYVTGQVNISGSSKIVVANNSNVVFKIGGYVDLNGNAAISSGTNSSVALLVDDAVQMSGNSSINSALLLATGNIDLNGSSALTGSAISTGGQVYLTNNAQVTFDATAIAAALTNNPGMTTGGGGAGGGTTVTPSEWKNL